MTKTSQVTPNKTAVVIPAGGAGRRFDPGQPKQFVDLAGWPVLAHTLSVFDQTPAVDQIVVAAPYDEISRVRREIVENFGFKKVQAVVPGGETRQESVYQGFIALDEDVDLVVVHDGVRPLIGMALIEQVIECAACHGAAIAAVPARDSLKRVENGVVLGGLPRDQVWQAQTPQAFHRALFAEALSSARANGYEGTDEAALVERLGKEVRVVLGSPHNIKITLLEDLALAENLIGGCNEDTNVRVGNGFDVHKLVSGRKLMLGGVEIPFTKGLLGHSDADVMVHAFCDAIFGAAGMGDIGRHFPDDDPKWSGAAGALLLEQTIEKVRYLGYELESADLTLLAQRPKIRNYIAEMKRTMAEALSVGPERINVKATTTEGLGPIGREEGLAAMATVLLTVKER